MSCPGLAIGPAVRTLIAAQTGKYFTGRLLRGALVPYPSPPYPNPLTYTTVFNLRFNASKQPEVGGSKRTLRLDKETEMKIQMQSRVKNAKLAR